MFIKRSYVRIIEQNIPVFGISDTSDLTNITNSYHGLINGQRKPLPSEEVKILLEINFES